MKCKLLFIWFQKCYFSQPTMIIILFSSIEWYNLCMMYSYMIDIIHNTNTFTIAIFRRRSVLEQHRADGLDRIGSVKWSLALCLLAVFLLVYFSLWKGVRSTGMVSCRLKFSFPAWGQIQIYLRSPFLIQFSVSRII